VPFLLKKNGVYVWGLVVILTSNKAFPEWGEIFVGDTIMTSATLDRLLHRSSVIDIRGDSYRLKGKRLTKSSPTENEVLQKM